MDTPHCETNISHVHLPKLFWTVPILMDGGGLRYYYTMYGHYVHTD
jgi:hypothetical protein